MKITRLPFKVKYPILACGGDIKGAFALANNQGCILVEGFGDLGDLDNFTAYEAAIKECTKKFNIIPKMVACDLHSGYFSTHFAESYRSRTAYVKLCMVQHHQAHIASSMAEAAIKGDVIGVAFDGTGLGLDGNIWGAEFFVGGMNNFRRAAHLEYISIPGMDAAIREPWRMAAAYLYSAFGNKFSGLKIDLMKKIDKRKWDFIKNMIDKDINSPRVSSMGRLFDAVGSIVLSKGEAAFEAELPMQLENMAFESCRESYDFDIDPDKSMLIIKTPKIIKGIVKDLSSGLSKAYISSKFHNTVSDMVVNVSLKLKKRSKINKVVLSGGVFQNKYLKRRAVEGLQARGFDVYAQSNIPANDSGIPVGQIAIANAGSGCV